MNDGSQQPPVQPHPPVQPASPPLPPQAPAQPIQQYMQSEIPPQQENIFIATPPPKKPSKWPLVIIIIAAVLLLVGGGIAAYYAFFQSKNTETMSLQPAKPSISKAEELINKVSVATTKELDKTYPNLTIESGTQAPVYQSESAGYAVYSGEVGKSLTISDGSATLTQPAQTDIEKVAKETLAKETDLKVTVKAWQSVYQNDAVICTVSTASTPITVSCANITDYASLITDVKTFATAYFAIKDNEQYKDKVAFSTPKITEKSNGFSNASVLIVPSQDGVGGFAGLFYAKDNNWTYWQGAQAILMCTDYSNSDLQRAFEGDTCTTKDNKEATVQVTL